MVCQDGRWYLFFEVMNQDSDRGELGLVRASGTPDLFELDADAVTISAVVPLISKATRVVSGS